MGLLKEIVPRLSRIAIFGIPGLNAAQFAAAETAVRALALEAEVMEVPRRWPRLPPQAIKRFITARWPIKVVRLADLGLMHALHASQRHGPTDSGLALGTPAYMSPEQLEGEISVGAPADVYSLACVIFHALTGRPPHAADNSRRLIATRLGA